MNKPVRVYKSAKTDILTTARKILVEQGLGHLTTDNLIEKTGLSKGGLFYHFKTIDEIIYALSDMLIIELETDILLRASKDSIKKGAVLRASIHQSIADETQDHIALCRSLIEVVFGQRMIDSYSGFFDRYKKLIFNEGVDKMTVMTVANALDGYWYSEVFGFQLYSKTDKKKFLQHLISLTY